jgi:UDP-N-acetylmuramoylalanine--D-glutamate ligase
MELKGKKVIVFGLARSGVGAANLLSRLGADVTVTDKKTREELSRYTARLLPDVKLSFGGHSDSLLDGTDLIVMSPGVPLNIPVLIKAKERGIKIIGELELVYKIVSGLGIPFLAVTGTNGKSTTTTLLALMLRNNGFNVILCGNIGDAISEEIIRITESKSKGADNFDFQSALADIDYFVVEVSSFQLEAVESFKPYGSTILNVTPDHLDRYKSMDEYAEAKARVFSSQGKGDFLVLNADDAETVKLYKKHFKGQGIERSDVFFFSRKNPIRGVYLKDGNLYCDLPERLSFDSKHPLISCDEIKIKGVHNLENAMAASAMALLAEAKAASVSRTLKEFPGLEHRLEFVRELDGVTYINDSKGTNVGAVVKSLESFSVPVILIAGGRDKAGDFSALRPFVKGRVKSLILIGEAKDKIKKSLEDLAETVFAESLEEAVMLSRKKASDKDVVLLSPACASFDMFKDFEDRGRQFKKIVVEMA